VKRRKFPRISVLAALLSSTALFLAGPARADELAYSCGYDLCTINPDEPAEGSNLTQTPDSAGVELSPAWSPDGRWIAYSGEYTGVKGGLYQLFVLDPTVPPAQAEPVDLSDNSEAQPEWQDPPVWSPDSSLVAYEQIYLSGSQHHVFVSPFDGSSAAVPIGSLDAAGQGIHPSWTPDGRVVFGRGSLYVANPDGSGITPFASPAAGTQSVVSPDGKYVAVETSTNPSSVLVYKTADGSSVTMPKPGSTTTTDISWSPDSTRIAYSYHETSDAGLWVGPVANPSAGHVQHAPTGWVDEFNATFSPDGTRIAFDAMPALNGNPQIFIVPAGGGEAVQVTKTAVPNWQPAWKPCEGCAPPPSNETGTGGQGGTTQPGGTTPPGGTIQPGGAAKVPVKIKLAALQVSGLSGGNHFMTLRGIDCKAQGGHPELLPPELQKACHVEAIAEYVPPTLPGRILLKAGAIAFAKGSVNIPEGETKPLKLKLTGPGKKYAKPGTKLKLALTIRMTAPDQKPQTLKKTVKVKVAKG
jgi:Tol biopolymer transport system component